MKCPHCAIEISTHEASRCLDAWVDEAVVGASKDEEISRAYMGEEELSLEDKEYIWNEILPDYSTDITDAWEVVEKLAEGIPKTYLYLRKSIGGGYACRFDHHRTYD